MRDVHNIGLQAFDKMGIRQHVPGDASSPIV